MIPTYEDLFGGEAEAVSYYRALFPNETKTDEEISAAINTSFMKIEPIFGAFRDYEVEEVTVRNEHIKRAVCFEANTILTSGGGDINDNTTTGAVVSSEKLESASVTYDTSIAQTVSTTLMSTLGLLSVNAATLLSRYIRKTYNMGLVVNRRYFDVDEFGVV